jgi:LysR family hydrogen peroxide-inducible transcriptional activator
MNLRDLRYIVTVADTRNFNRAAELCFVSQPSLSKQIQKVEEELDTIIFERSNRRVDVTQTGEKIIERARRILDEADAIQQIAKESRDPLTGSFRLGIIPTLAPYLLPRILPILKKHLPHITLSLIEGQTDNLSRQLERGELDAILLALPLKNDLFHEEILFQEPFYLAVPHAHALAKRKRITLEDLPDDDLLLLEDGHCLRMQAIQLCRDVRQQNVEQFRATSLETLRQMVASGHGVTLMPALAVDKHARLSYIAFKEPLPTRLIGLSWRKTSPRSILLERISHLIRKEMKDMPRKGVQPIPLEASGRYR